MGAADDTFAAAHFAFVFDLPIIIHAGDVLEFIRGSNAGGIILALPGELHLSHLGIFHHLPGYVRRTVGQAQLQAQHVHQPLGCGLGPGIGHARLGQCRAAEYGQQRQQNTDTSLHINASNVFSRSAQR